MDVGVFNTTSAAKYGRVRPPYPRTLLEPITELTGTVRPLEWLDVAAGTGALTEVALELGHHVVAVEPEMEMACELLARLPKAYVRSVPASRLDELRPAEFDIVSVGQALHYLQLADFIQSVRQMAIGGLLVVCDNTSDGRGWFGHIGRRWQQHKTLISRDPVRAAKEDVVELLGPPLHSASVPHAYSYDLNHALDLLRSTSSFQAMAQGDQVSLLESATELFEDWRGCERWVEVGFVATSSVWRLDDAASSCGGEGL